MRRILPALGLMAALAMQATTPFAAQNKVDIPDYSTTARKDVPTQFKWSAEDLYPTDDAWRAELAAVTRDCQGIGAAGKGFTDSPKAMVEYLDRLTVIQKRLTRLGIYASIQSDMDMADTHYTAMKGEIQNLAVSLGEQLAFIAPSILALGKEKLDSYMKAEPRLAPYRFGLENTLRSRDHILPAEQQRIVTLTGLFDSAAGQASALLNDVEMPRRETTLSDGTKVLLNTANYERYRGSSNIEDRRRVMETFWASQAVFDNTLAALLDSGMKQHLFAARTYKYRDCLEATLFGNSIDEKVYTNLIQTVRENLAPMHRLLRLRQRMLGLPAFHYSDIYASAVKSEEKRFSYEEAQKLIQEAMAPMGPEYVRILKRAFADRWVDLYPNKGKQSGAYSNGVYGVHPFVKMNYDGSYDAVSTLAHELGHALHSHFSNEAQPFPIADYPTFLAEIASTFNENMLMHRLLKEEGNEAFKLYILDRYLDQVRRTLYRQTLFADFELAMHRRVESGQTLTADWLNQTYLDLTRTYYGQKDGVVDVEEYMQHEWSFIPHFYMNYYVFQYSTGIVASMALSDMVLREGEPGAQKYFGVLKAGGSRFPMDTLKTAGLDMTQPQPVQAAIRQFDSLVTEMEKLVDKMEKAPAAK